MNRVLVVFSDGLLSELDSARGLVSRSAWIRQAVEDKLMKEAVAPLVPEDGDFYSVERDGVSMTVARRGVRPEDIVIPEPKPKARRKKKGEPPKEYDFAKDRPKGCLCTYDMLGRIWNSACKIHDSASDRTQRYVETFLPSHCNRGACTGTIKPNGRCIRCNQEPLHNV